MMKATAITCLIVLADAQGPGNGVSKTTHAASNPFPGLSFMLKHLPTSAAEDSCSGNYCKAGSFPDGEKAQGRAQLIPAGWYTERNCALYSSLGSKSSASSSTSMTAPASLGADCTYSTSHAYDSSGSTLLFSAFAHDADICCKACAATKDCAGATYTKASSSGRRLQGPQMYEGFGLHLVDVKGSVTTGGLAVDKLEGHFETRLSGMGTFDQFMDYSTQLFSANLPFYYKSFKKDSVPMLLGQWTAATGATWYSIFVHVPESQMVIELVGPTNPIGDSLLSSEKFTQLEARVTKRNVELYGSKADDTNHMLHAVSVTRAASNMTAVEMFYTNIIKATLVQTVDAQGMSRRCYAWNTAKSDVCFVSRASTSAEKDAVFSVKAFEAMLWKVHATVLTSPAIATDKYNDNHYAVDTQVSGDYIATYLTNNNPYPINAATWYAYACEQDYLIDPTGQSIQVDLWITSGYPGCGEAKKALKAKKAVELA